MRCVYIAGPYRATNPDGTQDAWRIQQNIMTAMALGLEVWKRGAVAIIPHGNTFCFQNAHGTSDDVWLTGDLELLSRSDALLLTEDWQRSSGARAEHAYAEKLEIPIFYTVDEFVQWMEGAE